MGRALKSYILLITFAFLLTSLAGLLLMRSTPFLGEASAHTREFETNITIPANGTQALDLTFLEGDELELIFSFQVKENLPIDVWFMSYANYVRLMDGNEFLYFIDGSGQELKQATKVVSVTQHGTYELVFANYNNETVEVHLTYDINVYPIESEPEEETPFWQSAIFLAPIMLVVGILMGLIVSSLVRPRKAEDEDELDEELDEVEEDEIDEEEEDEEIDMEEYEEEPSEKPGEPKEEPEVAEKTFSPSFCGYCGKTVETPFCPFCGKMVQAPTTPLGEGSSET